MIKPRSEQELKLMRKSGEITAKALKKALKTVKAGVNLLEIEEAAAKEILDRGGKLSFPTVGNYKWATCLTVNDELVHGIPRDIVLKAGDKISIDVGAIYQGWHTDAAWSVTVSGQGAVDSGQKNFLQIGEEALWKAIKQAVAGNTIGDISGAIQSTIEQAGYSVSRTLIGHGVGKALHEEPEVPGFGKAGLGLILEKNMTIAIETIYAKGSSEVYLKDDGWTYAMKDGSLGGLFEMTVVVGEKKAEVLTDWRRV